MPSAFSRDRLRAPRRAHHEPGGQGHPHVVDAIVGEELGPGVELMAAPLAVLDHADLREPLDDEVVVVHPSGASHGSVRDERRPFDGEASSRPGQDRRRSRELHDRAVVRVPVVGLHVAQGRHEVGRRRSKQAGCFHDRVAEAALILGQVRRRTPRASFPGGGREGVPERVPVEMKRERRKRPVAQVAPFELELSLESMVVGVEPNLDGVVGVARGLRRQGWEGMTRFRGREPGVLPEGGVRAFAASRWPLADEADQQEPRRSRARP